MHNWWLSIEFKIAPLHGSRFSESRARVEHEDDESTPETWSSRTKELVYLVGREVPVPLSGNSHPPDLWERFQEIPVPRCGKRSMERAQKVVNPGLFTECMAKRRDMRVSVR